MIPWRFVLSEIYISIYILIPSHVEELTCKKKKVVLKPVIPILFYASYINLPPPLTLNVKLATFQTAQISKLRASTWWRVKNS